MKEIKRRDFLKVCGATAASFSLADQSKVLAAANPPSPSSAPRPNVILVFIDDMGYGDIGAYGSKTNKTPNIDKIAREGVKFSDFYLASIACSPSRAALMTGCYAERVGMDGRVCFPYEAKALGPDEYTMGQMFQDAGYATGCFGKWHLGHRPGFLPQDRGFDVYQGIPYSNDMWVPFKSFIFPPLPWIVGEEAVAIVRDELDQSLLTEATTKAALRFIKKHGAEKKPFFCYLPYAAVHWPWHGKKEYLRPGPDGEITEKEHYRAQVEELDDMMGQFAKTLKELNIEDDTLILFMSDNGGAYDMSDMGGLRGYKGGLTYEGHQRTLMLAKWPKAIPAGTTCSEIAITCDLLPTLAKFCGGKLSKRKIDGLDISELLLKPHTAKSPRNGVMQYNGFGCRKGKWKMVNQNELYDLQADPGETRNVATQHHEILIELNRMSSQWLNTIRKEYRPHAIMPESGGLVEGEAAKRLVKLSDWL